VHEDDRPLLGRYAFAHHRQVAAARGRESLEVLERGSHVLMAGQRVEVLLLVVVERGVLTHSSINVERVGEVLLGERIKDDLWLGHCTLLAAQCGAYTFTTECLTVTLTVDGSSRVEKTSSHTRMAAPMTSSSTPRLLPSSAAILLTTATSLPTNSPAVSMKDATDPRAATMSSTRLAALPCGRALSSVDSGTPSRAPSSTAPDSNPMCAANNALLTSFTF